MTNWLWLYFMARIWSPATQCGARSLWQGRAGLGQTGHFLCQHPNILLGAKPFRWSGKTWNFYNILWDQTSIVCFQRQIYLIEQIDLSSVLDKHVDKIFSSKKEMAHYVFLICKQTQGDPESSQIRWKKTSYLKLTDKFLWPLFLISPKINIYQYNFDFSGQFHHPKYNELQY